VVSSKTPAVISCNKGLNEPRYANLKGIMAAKKKPFVEQPAQLGARGMEIVALSLPAPRAAGKIVGNGADAVPALIAALRESKAL
jgi:electron transfer flavoprotein beta subunit